MIKKIFNPNYKKIANIEQLITSMKQEFNGFVNTFYSFENIKPKDEHINKQHVLISYMLKNLKKICNKLDIKFWLHGGTLLGAVRHSGFIPWDDEVDLGMMREDLEKLKAHLKDNEEFEVKYFYFLGGIKSIMARFVFKNRNIPLFLDIFAYDYCNYSKKDETWSRYLAERELIMKQIKRSGIKNNLANLLNSNKDENFIMNLMKNSIEKFSSTDKKTGIVFGVEHFTSSFERIYDMDFIFPLTTLSFEGEEYFAPKCYKKYLYNQYGNWHKIPRDVGIQKHMYNFTKQHFINIDELYESITKEKTHVVGYTAGGFDLFHIGHLNLLKKAKENCDYLICGVTTDELIKKTKNKSPVIPFEERVEMLKQCRYVDRVVEQNDLDKVKAWEEIKYDILFSGDDWKENPRWQKYEEMLKSHGVSIVYFPYTKTTSSSMLTEFINKFNKEG